MRKKVVFYLPKGTVNDATEYYISVIERALTGLGIDYERVSSLKNIRLADYIFTIEAKGFFFCKLFNPRAKILNWFQGVVPEEAQLVFNSNSKKILWTFFETFTLKLSIANIFVSQAMLRHYEEKYKLNLSAKSFIMPCYNKQINTSSFFIENKYDNQSFIYAGSLAKWQCFEETLSVFDKIQKALPNACLTILTGDVENAKELVSKYQIQNVTIKYVPLPDLDNELAKNKYGFLIRKDHIVNKVATPTKMNSYLANGIIPIFTNAIDDFNRNINLHGFTLNLDTKNSEKKWAEDIIHYEKHVKINNEAYLDEVKKIFSNYYNDDSYIEKIKGFLNRVIF